MEIITYIDFLNENFFEDFRTQYSKLFTGMDQDMYRDFGEYMKRVEKEADTNNLARLYNQFLTANQTTFNKKVDGLQSIDQINKMITDNIKTLYYAIKPIIYKMNKETFTMETIFGNTGIKKLMILPEKEFANKMATGVNDVINDIMAKSGIKQQQNTQQQPNQPQTANQPTTEHLNVLMRILEADEPTAPTTQPNTQQPQPTQPQTANNQQQEKEQADNLKKYQTATKNWFQGLYKMIFDSSKELMTQATKEAPINNQIDNVSKMMKGSNNMLAKSQLLNKITTLDKNQLQQLGKNLGLNFEEIGNF